MANYENPMVMSDRPWWKPIRRQEIEVVCERCGTVMGRGDTVARFPSMHGCKEELLCHDCVMDWIYDISEVLGEYDEDIDE